MSNTPLNKKGSLDALKRFLFDNKVILLFVGLSIACILIADTSVSYVASEVASRFARNTCIVLALIIPCLAGLGMNFGIVVGAIAAQISIFWVVHWGFTGISGFMLCVLMSTPLAVFFGWLLGKLFNKTKGAEMIAGLVLGFFAAGLYRLFVLYIMGGVIPFDDPNLLDRGFGLRNAFDLTGNLKYALDDISFLTTASVLSIVGMVSTVVVALHDKKVGKEGQHRGPVHSLPEQYAGRLPCGHDRRCPAGRYRPGGLRSRAVCDEASCQGRQGLCQGGEGGRSGRCAGGFHLHPRSEDGV